MSQKNAENFIPPEPPNDVSFIDDATVVLYTRNETAINDLTLAMQIIFKTFAKFGLLLNFETGKSENIPNLFGSGSNELKSKCFGGEYSIIKFNALNKEYQ